MKKGFGFRDHEEATGESSQHYSSEDGYPSFEDLNTIELDALMENGKSSGRSDSSDEGPIIYEDNWTSITWKQKWSLFFRRLWQGPEIAQDLPPRFSNRYLALFEELPKRIKDAFPWKIKALVAFVYFIFWGSIVCFLLTPSLTSPPTYTMTDEEGKKQSVEVISLSCNEEKSFWKGKNAACGLDGEKCKPFEDRDVVFRCPALCDRGSWTYSSIPIGDQNIKYRGYFVGGGVLSEKNGDQLTFPYRADSYPCGAATHAGILSPLLGGCAKISYIGAQTTFPSTKGFYGVDDSIEFDAPFPSSYVFKELLGTSDCYDPRILVAVLNILFGFPVMYLCTGFLAFWVITTVGFWTICLTIDPPIIVNVLDPESFPTLISLGLERFLPTVFILYTLWHFAIGNTLSDPEDPKIKPSPVSKAMLWYPLFWIGVLNNLTFDRLPVDRLTMEDLKEQPGSLTAVASIIITIATCAVTQAYKLWQSGKFRVYLYLYISFIFGLIFISQIRGLTLRIHHYILAMLLIPGTGTKGLSAMLFQGLLVGLFLSGTSRWGLASIAETTRALRRADPSGTIKPPFFIDFNNQTKVLSWSDQDVDLPDVIDGEIQHPSDELRGYSLLLNDIERYKGNETSIDLGQLILGDAELQHLISESLKTSSNINIYMRLSRASLSTSRHSDYTRAALLQWPGGKFSKPEPGIT